MDVANALSRSLDKNSTLRKADFPAFVHLLRASFQIGDDCFPIGFQNKFLSLRLTKLR